eukprot:CAMPEP_0174347750 /NCGR_PEP_ID=MMETSP0811_2-20130205/3918_1 /TAXON_ID=73025 ORGANISM="Eutreptiella gymnastica-like, Strain CCMP1594" /NCGR_SAMPLE_ID=MMETSP0811_2 /ASSEMBLY_ACC=CAM_ASM_000667 /LENGTH=111 /DNA_ID=CAMNT_0015473579 /DNA_START=190 /DNA_END=527 /DNA_ORIENTATION=+
MTYGRPALALESKDSAGATGGALPGAFMFRALPQDPSIPLLAALSNHAVPSVMQLPGFMVADVVVLDGEGGVYWGATFHGAPMPLEAWARQAQVSPQREHFGEVPDMIQQD